MSTMNVSPYSGRGSLTDASAVMDASKIGPWNDLDISMLSLAGLPEVSRSEFPPLDFIREQLLEKCVDFTRLCLYSSARWCAELARCIPFSSGFESSQYATDSPSGMFTTPTTVEKHSKNRFEKGPELVSLTLAKTFFDMKEYKRVVRELAEFSSPDAIMLSCYALFLDGEKSKFEHDGSILGNQQGERILVGPGKNENLLQIHDKLSPLRIKGVLSGEALFVLGTVLREMNLKDQSRVVLCEAVTKSPYLWCAWYDLGILLDQNYKSQLSTLPIPNHWMRHFFLVHSLSEVQRNVEALRSIHQLLPIFPQSVYLQTMEAMSYYSLREFTPAEEKFEAILAQYPDRLDGLDAYSNILYVKEDRRKLSMLAQLASKIDRYRPETCCIIANYYSMKREHEKAVLYFERALKLNSRYLSAWTLMGHEYIEMKNTDSAIEAYRRAVEVNPNDFRAWYGLGQTYEILKMPFYSIYYYRKATALRPYDPRMWCALGDCFQSIKGSEEALRCYERAVINGDKGGIASHKLAALYHKLDEHEKAAYYYKMNLDRLDNQGIHNSDYIDSLLFLAQHCMNIGSYDDCERYCFKLLDFAGSQKESAKALLRELNSIRGKVPQ